MPIVQLADGSTGLQALVDAITTAINTTEMWNNLAILFGAVGGLVLFSFLLYEVRKLVKGAQKGKARI